jgi:hypothetical protein
MSYDNNVPSERYLPLFNIGCDAQAKQPGRRSQKAGFEFL